MDFFVYDLVDKFDEQYYKDKKEFEKLKHSERRERIKKLDELLKRIESFDEKYKIK